MSNQRVEKYWGRMLESGLVETKQHHEFRDGLHGYKADYGRVAPDGSNMFYEGAGLVADHISDHQHYSGIPQAIVGVANGANKLALAVAEELGPGVIGVQTAKNRYDPSILELPLSSRWSLIDIRPEFALVLDDIGTSGSTTAQVANLCIDLNIPRVEALYLVQRSTNLHYLGRIGVAYQTVIYHPMINMTEVDCQKSGPCSVGVELVEHPNRRHPVS